MQLPPDAPPPRLCIVEKLPGETEYGYNLHAEKSRGQFVGIVDAGSAAERGGLQQGDRIFAVNGHSIVNENHKKVVERIKQNSQRCELLVISEDGAKWYAENGIAITPDLPNVVRINEVVSIDELKLEGIQPAVASTEGLIGDADESTVAGGGEARSEGKASKNGNDCPSIVSHHQRHDDLERLQDSSAADRTDAARTPLLSPRRMEHLDDEQRSAIVHLEKAIGEDNDGEAAEKTNLPRFDQQHDYEMLELHKDVASVQFHIETEPVFVPPPPPTTMKPLPLLAKLEKTSPNDEFGFNLHAEKGRGHFIGTVDAGGIGERAGLRMGQRIVGVNDTLVYPTTPHKEVVALIKISPLLTTLLVASEDVDHWHRHNDVPYSFDEADGLPQQKSRSTTIAGQQLNPHSIQVGGDAETIMHHQNAEQKDEHVTENHGSHEPDVYNAYAPVAETSDEDLLDQVFSEVALPTTHVMGGPRSATGTSLSSHRESAVDVPTSHYMPTHVHDQHSPQYGGQSSPLSNGSSGYNAFSATNADDIYHLPAKDARERLRNRNRKFKGHDMSLNEKYEVVSNM